MNPSKLADKAAELKEMVEEGDLPETVAAVYPPELRKQIKKAWPLLHEHLETVEEKLGLCVSATDELFHQLDLLGALSSYAAMLDAAEKAEAPIEVVDAHPLPEEDD